jgi:hypothetical protein
MAIINGAVIIRPKCNLGFCSRNPLVDIAFNLFQVVKRLLNIRNKQWITYRSQDKSNGMDRNWIKEIRIYNSFIPLILEPHHVNRLLNDRVIVYSFTLAV